MMTSVQRVNYDDREIYGGCPLLQRGFVFIERSNQSCLIYCLYCISEDISPDEYF